MFLHRAAYTASARVAPTPEVRTVAEVGGACETYVATRGSKMPGGSRRLLRWSSPYWRSSSDLEKGRGAMTNAEAVARSAARMDTRLLSLEPGFYMCFDLASSGCSDLVSDIFKEKNDFARLAVS